MKELTLKNISLACSILGIIGLFFLSECSQIEEKNIPELQTAKIGTDVKVSGIIISAYDSEKVSSAVIRQTQKNAIKLRQEQQNNTLDLGIVLFRTKNEKLNLSGYKGREVSVTGSIDYYEGKIQIIVDELKIS